jgi:amino-acid N-acetyltransferase
MFARKAILPDASAIESLISVHVGDGTLLPRTLAEICENVRDFVVLEHKGEIIGCGALHLYGVHLAEIRSITVRKEFKGKGAGRLIVNALMKEAEAHCVTCVCLFTRIPKFFTSLGFQFADRNAIPDKLYKDCMNCPRINDCDEIAMYQGELPNIAILAPKHVNGLVEIGR